MKKIKYLATAALLTLGVLATTTPVSANSSESQPIVIATITNNDTLEEKNVEVKKVISTPKTYSNEITDVYEAYFSFPVETNARSSQSTSKDEAGVHAYISVTYNTSGYGENGKIQVTNVNGSWQYNHGMYSLSNRSYHIDANSWSNYFITYNIGRDEFSLNPGWGYVYWPQAGDIFGIHAGSQAVVSVVGMSGTSHTIDLRLNV